MQRTAKITASVGLLVVVSGALALGFGNCTDRPKRLYRHVFLGDDSVSENLKFKPYIAGNGRLPDGTVFDFQTLMSSDCVKVTAKTFNEGSIPQAEGELQRLAITASQVIETGVKTNREGKVVGKRVVLVFDAPQKKGLVAWTLNNGRLITIESVSLSHALEYEKRLDYPRTFPSR